MHAVAETNFSIFHTNVDFSLQRVEAPQELHPLGKQLSKARRESAEEGSFHILARRLGVLFDGVLPDVPALIKAYGTRASEIVQKTTQTSKKPEGLADGFFGSHLGIDSTSIWASATSGKRVLRMHLLACMLACLWSPQEATAIWVELVSQRQKEIKAQSESGEIADMLTQFASAAAVHHIERSSLASWDASARAWLQVADQAMRAQQVQVQLIVDNLHVAVKSHSGVDRRSKKSYDSVMHNIKQALEALDNLVKGVPQKIADGGIMLGLVSWHLYPDIVVLGSSTKEIHQQDPLVQTGGIVTMSIAPSTNGGKGVYWSLPLASLRSYGIVQRERSTMKDRKRMTQSEFQALIFGASFGVGETAIMIAEILQYLWKTYNDLYLDELNRFEATRKFTQYHTPLYEDDMRRVDMYKINSTSFKDILKILQLIYPFQGGIELLLSPDEEKRKIANHLMRYGSNYGRSWIGLTDVYASVCLGLTELPTMIRMASHSTTRIKILRQMAAQDNLDQSNYVIRFKALDGSWAFTSVSSEENGLSRGSKRKRDHSGMGTSEIPQEIQSPPDENWVFMPAFSMGIPGLRGSDHLPDVRSVTQALNDDTLEDLEDLIDFEPRTGKGANLVTFRFAFGDPEIAAVYSRDIVEYARVTKYSSTVPLRNIWDLLQQSALSTDALGIQLLQHFERDQPAYGDSLVALGRVIDYYQSNFPQATISMSVIEHPINTWKWMPNINLDLESLTLNAHQVLANNGKPFDTIYIAPMSREQVFAAILQLESGTINVDVAELTEVLAISSGNSLFIANDILRDPVLPMQGSSCPVSHALGNIGKPGIALLTPPPAPEIRKHERDRWRFVEHKPFDGELTGGKFEETSIHLSFTPWEEEISIGRTRDQDKEAYYVEAVVSAFDGSEWIGDLDILKGLRNMRLGEDIFSDSVCTSNPPHDPSFSAAGAEMVTIDCWEEILDPPKRFLMLRSSSDTQNRSLRWQWMVRLAAVSIASSKRYECICLPLDRDFCWTCRLQPLMKFNQRTENRVLFIR